MPRAWLARSIAPVTAVALAACRLGFDVLARPPIDDATADPTADAPPDDPATIRLVVTSDEYASEPAGTPIAGATVLVDRGAGLERSVTDAAGIAQVVAAGVVACHVVLRSELGWRVYTLIAPPGGTIELGGRPAPSLNRAMTIAIPNNGSLNYTIRLPERCAFPPEFSDPELAIDYNAGCEGQSVRAIAFSQNQRSADVYLDVSNVVLANHTRQAVTGAYVGLPAHTITLSHLPDDVGDVFAELLARSGRDLLPLSRDAPSATPQAGTASVAAAAAPGGNALRVQGSNTTLPIQYSSTSQAIVPVTLATAIAFDARGMLPLFRSLVLTAPPSVSWTGSGTSGTILAVETITGQVQWDAYLDPSATRVTFPAIPADLGVPTPTSFDFATVVKLDVPGATTASLTRTIDRTWSQWPDDATVLPPEGSATARILYSVGLGPP